MAIPTRLVLNARFEEIYFDSAVKNAALARHLRDSIRGQHGALKWLDLYWLHEAWDLGDEIDPDLEDLARAEGALERLDELFGMFLQASAAAEVFAVMTLEAHINCVASDGLTGATLGVFDRLSLEGKWLFLPRLLGKQPLDPGAQPFQDFAKLVQRRNRLVHTKSRDRIVSVLGGEAIEGYLEQLLDGAERALDTVRGMGERLAFLLGVPPPTWAKGVDATYYHLIAEDLAPNTECA